MAPAPVGGNQQRLRVTKRNGTFADLRAGAADYRLTRRSGLFLPFSFGVSGFVRVTKRNGTYADLRLGGLGTVHLHQWEWRNLYCGQCSAEVMICAVCGQLSCGHSTMHLE